VIFQAGQRVLFIGDSITDCDRRDLAAPFGDGYMNLVRAFVIARHPQLRLHWFNRGISGDTVRDLAHRWERDVTALQPDWLAVMIGINDIWRGYQEGSSQDRVPIDEYEKTLRDLLRRAVDGTGCRLILADPYLIEPDPQEPQRAETDRHCGVVAALAEEFEAVHVKTQQAFTTVLAATSPEDWAEDRIHPNLPGHAVIAQAFLDVIG
jgi:lysophospholipase L1-like esterase